MDKEIIAACRWFSPGTPVSSTNKTNRHDIIEILLKVALNTTNLTYIVLVIILVCQLRSKVIRICSMIYILFPIPERIRKPVMFS